MRRLIFLCVLLIGLATSVSAQSYPEVEALLDAFLAKDPDAVLKHLPESVRKAVSEMTPAERAETARGFMLGEVVRREGGIVTRLENDKALIRIEHIDTESDERSVGLEILLDKRVSDGYEAILRFKMRSLDAARPDSPRDLVVWMRFEEGEWRVTSAQFVDSRGIDLDSPEFVKNLRHNRAAVYESSALGAIRSINTACVTYASTYPDVGFPPKLDALGGADREPTSEHSELLDSSLTSSPYERSGYRFSYHPVGGSPTERYTATARPIQFGTTGTRSFFTDESGVIRWTEEDREPTIDDPPLE